MRPRGAAPISINSFIMYDSQARAKASDGWWCPSGDALAKLFSHKIQIYLHFYLPIILFVYLLKASIPLPPPDWQKVKAQTARVPKEIQMHQIHFLKYHVCQFWSSVWSERESVGVYVFVNLLTPQKVARLGRWTKPATTFIKCDIDIHIYAGTRS